MSMVTELIGDYRVESRLSVGGMSEVFLAGAASGERVVVKVLLPQHQALPEARAAFEHEARLGQTLAHPNLVKTLGSGMSSLGPYLVLEWVDGVNVARMIAESDRFSAAAVLVVALDLLSALQHLHNAKSEDGSPLHIVHRDISPDNMMIQRTGEAKLLDFGIARSALRETRTRTGFVRGKLKYLSPEQATGSELDVRSDLYSLAAVLYEMATGQPHLRGGTDLELLRCAEDPVFEKPSHAGADVCLDAFLERALSRFAEDRYPSAKSMEKVVRDCLRTLSADAIAFARAELAQRVENSLAQSNRTTLPESQLEGDSTKNAPEPNANQPDAEPRIEHTAPRGSTRWADSIGWAHIGVFLAGAAAVWLIKPVFEVAKPANTANVESTGSFFSPNTPASNSAALSLSNGFVAIVPPRESAATSPPAASIAAMSSAVRSPLLEGTQTGSAPTVRFAAALPSPGDIGSVAPVAHPPSVVSGTPEPAASAVLVAPNRTPKEAATTKMAAVSARIKAAKSKGHDVSRLEARAVVALQAYLDGRYDDTERALDKIASEIPP